VTVEPTRRRGRPRNASIDTEIYAATVDELIEKGFLALSMESIAARAGVAKTTLYRRWPAAHELCAAAISSLEPEPDQAPPAGGTVRDDLLVLLQRMRRKWASPRYGALMRRAAADGSVRPEVYLQVRDKVVAPHVAAMNTVLRRGIDEGLVRPDVDLDWARQLLAAPILAATMTLKSKISAAQVEFTVDTVLRGLAP